MTARDGLSHERRTAIPLTAELSPLLARNWRASARRRRPLPFLRPVVGELFPNTHLTGRPDPHLAPIDRRLTRLRLRPTSGTGDCGALAV